MPNIPTAETLCVRVHLFLLFLPLLLLKFILFFVVLARYMLVRDATNSVFATSAATPPHLATVRGTGMSATGPVVVLVLDVVGVAIFALLFLLFGISALTVLFCTLLELVVLILQIFRHLLLMNKLLAKLIPLLRVVLFLSVQHLHFLLQKYPNFLVLVNRIFFHLKYIRIDFLVPILLLFNPYNIVL
jgi:hypothetical protein